MKKQLQKALNTPPDFSEAFNSLVKKIHKRLSNSLGVSLFHDNDMNYSAAHQIKIHFDDEYSPIEFGSNAATYELVVLISSKGSYFTYVCLENRNNTDSERSQLPTRESYWIVLKIDDIPGAIKTYMAQISKEVTSLGYVLLSGSILDEMVEGVVTDMDGVPATVFQVLFSELY